MQIDKENGGSDRSGKTWRGCLFCKAGKERNAIQELRVCAPEMRAVAPVKLRARRVGGVTRAERVSLIPGYIFVEIDTLDLPFRLTKLENVLKLLTYPNGDWQLSGYDDQFARTMFENNGEIGFSKAVFDEENVESIIAGNTSKSPKNTSFTSAITNAMMKNAIQIQFSTISAGKVTHYFRITQ